MKLNVGYLGLALVLVGATLLAMPTLGFETIAADRGAQVETTVDADALLGVIDNSGAGNSEIKHNDPGIVYYLNDNAGEFPAANDIQATVIGFSDGDNLPGATVEEAPTEDDYQIVAECGDVNDNTEGTVTVLIEASGDVNVDMERTTTQEVNVKCQGGGNDDGAESANFVADNVAPDGTQTFSFDGSAIDNKQWVEIDLSDAQGRLVDYSDDENNVSIDKNVREMNFEDGVLEIQAQGNWDGPVGVTVSNADILQGGIATAEYSDDQNRGSSDEFRVPVVTTGDASLGIEAIVSAINASGSVSAGDRLDADGSVSVGGDFTTATDAQIDGTVDVGGNIETGHRAMISGDVTAGERSTLP